MNISILTFFNEKVSLLYIVSNTSSRKNQSILLFIIRTKFSLYSYEYFIVKIRFRMKRNSNNEFVLIEFYRKSKTKNINKKVASHSVTNLTNYEHDEHTICSMNMQQIWQNTRYVWRIRNKSRTYNKFAIEQKFVLYFFLFFLSKSWLTIWKICLNNKLNRKKCCTNIENDFNKSFNFIILYKNVNLSFDQ